MVGCFAYGCTNLSGKESGRGKSFFKIPRPSSSVEKQRGSQWLHNSGRKYDERNFSFTKNKTICEDHFHPDCFKIDKKALMLGYHPHKNMLVDGAIPTIFQHRVYDMINVNGTIVNCVSRESTLKRNLKQKHDEVISKVFSEPSYTGNSENTGIRSKDVSTSTEFVQNIPLIFDRIAKKGFISKNAHEASIVKTTYIDASTQTENVTHMIKKLEISTQAPEVCSINANVYGVIKDHTYCNKDITSTPRKESKEIANNCKLNTSVSTEHSFNTTGTTETYYDPLDESFVPDSDETVCSEVNETSDIERLQERKFVVFESMLDELFNLIKCNVCNGHIDEFSKIVSGTSLQVKLICVNDHTVKIWESQPTIGRMPLFNLLYSAAIFFSGSTYEHAKKPAELSGLEFINHNTFYEIQRKFLLPSINNLYNLDIEKSRDEVRGIDLAVLGDGRFDSPGKSAKYCTYVCQSPSSKKVVATSTIQCLKGRGSSPLEVKGFINCLGQFDKDSFPISTVATDRNQQLAKWLREERPEIEHTYDLWHFSKNIKSKLRPLIKSKKRKVLEGWIKPVGNHLFWCSENCAGDPVKLTQMWLSLLYHVTNRHKFSKKYPNYPKCDHKRYTKEESHKKKWIVKDSPAYVALEKVICDKKNLKDMHHLTNPYHTGSVESFNSLINMYAPKRQEFSINVMDARVKLAVLDHNCNVGRKQSVIKRKIKNGADIGKKKWKFQCSRLSKDWVAKEVKVPKSYQFANNLILEVMRRKASNIVEIHVAVAETPANIAPIERPSTSEIISKRERLSRFKRDDI